MKTLTNTHAHSPYEYTHATLHYEHIRETELADLKVDEVTTHLAIDRYFLHLNYPPLTLLIGGYVLIP